MAAASVAAIMVVRDEDELIERNVRFHLDVGFSTVAVLDHCSTDGTSDILQRLAADYGVIVVRDDDPAFDHGRLSNRLMGRVLEAGRTDWIVPLDADEFLHVPGGVQRFVEELAATDTLYGSVQWFNALWSESEVATFGSSPLLTKWFYQPWPERDWQHFGHFRKAFCRVHSGMQMVVGGHYFRRESNAAFFATRREPVVVSDSAARIYHYEFRDSAGSLFAKWRKLAQFEQDSSSAQNAPWMERLERIKGYVRDWEARPQESERFWSMEPRTFWGTPVPRSMWECAAEPAEWQAKFVPSYERLRRPVDR